MLLGNLCAAQSVQLKEVMPVPADTFVESIGVNTHLGYSDTIYREYEHTIKPRLLELGVRHIRDGTFNDEVARKYLDLGKHGIKVLLITDSRRAVSKARAIAPALFAIEGMNEPDTRGNDWVERTRADQRALYEAIKGDSALAQFPVLVSSLANIRDNPAKLGSLTQWLDYGNIHPYAAGQPPSRHWGWGTTMERALGEARKVSEHKPIIATECGYHNRLLEKGHPGCSETAAGNYFPRLLAVYFNAGLKRSYTYEFADEKHDPEFLDKEQHFGLIRRDGSPKPAFVALKNMISLLKNPGEAFQPTALAFSLETRADNIHQLLLQKRNGRHFLLLWQEAACYDTSTRKDIEVPDKEVTLNLATPAALTIYRPSSSDTVWERVTSGRKHNLRIPAELAVIEIMPD